MNAYFDTAIIIKLYVREANSSDVVRLVSDFPVPYLLMPWQNIEVLTAIRLKAFRKEINLEEMQASLAAFKEDVRLRRWVGRPYSERRVFELVRDLSDRHAASLGCRTLDLVHVATAIVAGVAIFVTFDERQRTVASLEGLTVKP